MADDAGGRAGWLVGMACVFWDRVCMDGWEMKE